MEDFTMKRSEINAIIREMEALIREHGSHLPPFCNWTPEEWRTKGHEYDEIRETETSTTRSIRRSMRRSFCSCGIQ